MTATLVGSLAADQGWWPKEISAHVFVSRALDLAADVSRALPRRPQACNKACDPHAQDPKERRTVADDAVRAARARDAFNGLFFCRTLLRSTKSGKPRQSSTSSLDSSLSIPGPCQPFHAVLSFGAAVSNLDTVFATSDQVGAQIELPFAARMLLEEAGRMAWRYSEWTASVFEARATQYFDEYRARRKKVIDQLTASGVPRGVAEQLFELPQFVDISNVPVTASPGRKPLPSVSEMLTNLGAMFVESEWLNVAYSLLSQMTHMTALGLLHS